MSLDGRSPSGAVIDQEQLDARLNRLLADHAHYRAMLLRYIRRSLQHCLWYIDQEQPSFYLRFERIEKLVNQVIYIRQYALQCFQSVERTGAALLGQVDILLASTMPTAGSPLGGSMSPNNASFVAKGLPGMNGHHESHKHYPQDGSVSMAMLGTVSVGTPFNNNRLLYTAGEVKEAIRFWREQCTYAQLLEPKVFEADRISDIRHLALTGEGTTIEEKARALRISCEQTRLVSDEMEPFLDRWQIILSAIVERPREDHHGHAAADLYALILTSRYLHVFARNDLVWRRLFFATRDRKSIRLVYRGSWLLTYLFPQPEHDNACANHPLVTDRFIAQDVFSEFLHHQWLRSNTSLEHFYPPPPTPPMPAIGDSRPVNPTIPIENYDDLDTETFYRRYGYANRPVMIQNSGVESWPAWEQWALDSLATKYGDTSFRISNIDSDKNPSFRVCFNDFLHYLRYNRDQDPLYLFDPNFVETVPEMGSAYKASQREASGVPKYFEFDFFSLLKGDSRPPYRWLLIGPQRTGAPWHTDPSGTSAWNTLLSGHKRWALYPPHMIPPGHDPTSQTRLTSVEWYLDVYPFLAPELRPIEIVQYPGQTIYVPSGWWHMVLNMDDTVAVTQNFVDDTNLIQVKHSMQADEKETAQIHRWNELAQELRLARPDLALAVAPRPEEVLLEQLKAEGSWPDPHAKDSANQWDERVRDVVQRVIGIDPGKISLVGTGENVCFLTTQGFVKFFTPFHDGHDSFLSEVQANKILLATPAGSVLDRVLTPPRMLGYGYLLDRQASNPTAWRWPFIVAEAVSDQAEARKSMPEDESGYNILLPPMLRTLNYLSSHVVDVPRTSQGYISRCLQTAALNHARWRVFPKHLLQLLPNYLPKDPQAVFNPSEGDRVASLVHGDINPGNVLGRLDEEHQTFMPLSLIDYGDAILLADPLIDIVSVFVTILNCRQDLGMTNLLLDYWRHTGMKPISAGSDRTLARRCMWHVLLWPSQGLSLHLVNCVPEIGEMNSWEQLEDTLFGWWSSL
ncbi:hypothetical protein BGX28_000875 [Mortierella sp. GBA30]|nr:hypothetical protein BGX28_000875 [Mortierella sp. GBA30]